MKRKFIKFYNLSSIVKFQKRLLSEKRDKLKSNKIKNNSLTNCSSGSLNRGSKTNLKFINLNQNVNQQPIRFQQNFGIRKNTDPIYTVKKRSFMNESGKRSAT